MLSKAKTLQLLRIDALGVQGTRREIEFWDDESPFVDAYFKILCVWLSFLSFLVFFTCFFVLFVFFIYVFVFFFAFFFLLC